MNYRIIKAICKEIASANIAANISNFAIRIDEPTPCGVIIPALEIIQLSLYGEYLAVRAKLGGKKLEITGPKAAVFIVPGEGVPLPGGGVRRSQRTISCTCLCKRILDYLS